MFARISRRYDLMNAVMTVGMHGQWRRLAARLATEGMVPGPALDIATGTGDLAFTLTRLSTAQPVVGADFTPQMLAVARAKERARRGVSPVSWLLADALALPFPDGTFMCATAGFALRNLTDLRQGLVEMARVVRPGGRVVVLEAVQGENQGPGVRLLRAYFRRVVPFMGRILAGDRDAYTYLPESVERFPTAEGLAGLMEDVGLVNVRWRLVGLGLVSIHVGEVPCY
jgi:demethylmenaquinone methyltransferase/2-methoxy-6-polyprenyl-1,4-benzoquinol methylase